MRSNVRMSEVFRPAPRRTVESALLDCVNRGEPMPIAADDLVMAVSSGKIEGLEERLARLYTEMLPHSVISFFGDQGVTRMQIVGAYEVTKKRVGCRSLAFEQAFSGQFAFTS